MKENNGILVQITSNNEKSVSTHLCDVCKKNPMYGVYASTCGPISNAYCEECGKSGAEPYGVLVAYISSAVEKGEDVKPEAEKIHPNYQKIIDASLKVAGKTREEFYEDINKAITDYLEYEKQMYENAQIESNTKSRLRSWLSEVVETNLFFYWLGLGLIPGLHLSIVTSSPLWLLWAIGVACGFLLLYYLSD